MHRLLAMKTFNLFLFIFLFLCNGIFAASRGLHKFKPKISPENTCSTILTQSTCDAAYCFQQTENFATKKIDSVEYAVSEMIARQHFYNESITFLSSNSSPPDLKFNRRNIYFTKNFSAKSI